MKNMKDIIDEWHIDEETIILEPQDVFNEGIIGVSEDKNHLIYSYQKLTDSLAESYEKEFYENNKEPNEDEIPDFVQDACEWLDYNTIRALPYMDSEHCPIIMYEI